MRVCFIHIGTHKTGSTALQVLLAHSRQVLANVGLYVTATGRSDAAITGNHEIAWDLLARGRDADLSGIVKELGENPCRHAILTSEDFDRIHSRRDAIPALAGAIREAGYVPKMIVYLRGQATYAESVYVEMIKHGIVLPFDSFIESTLANGRFQAENTGLTEFTYSRLLAPWVEELGRENVAVRPYDSSLDILHIFRDFFNIIAQNAAGFTLQDAPLSVPMHRVNDSLTFGGLLDTAYEKLFPDGRVDVEPRAVLREQLPDLPSQLLDQRYALMTRDETLRFVDVFGRDNDEIARSYGAQLAFSSPADVGPADAEIWQKARVERATFQRMMMLWKSVA